MAAKADFDAGAAGPALMKPRTSAAVQRLISQAARRMSWGVVDQGMSSLTNFAVAIYVVRVLGAVQFGAFSLAYVTYGFALNASRGLGTDPLMVRFSGTNLATWRRVVADCTGSAVTVGLAIGACVIVAAALLRGTVGSAFLALGLTLPGLLLQDSWRYSFFALGRGNQAFLNDLVWAVTLLPALVLLRKTGHADVFWFMLAWGATASIGAAVGPWQARVVPKPSGAWRWISRHRDLGLRYMAEGLSSSASSQLLTYGIGLLLGLAVVGYVQASSTLMGPVGVLFTGMSLVSLPEAARVLRSSPRRLPLVCMLVFGGLAAAVLVWGAVLLVAVPRGFGAWLLGPVWRPAYPLLLPQLVTYTGLAFAFGMGTGLHALGAARRSLRAVVISSGLYLVFGLSGAVVDGAFGVLTGLAIAQWIAAPLFWWQLRAAMRESGKIPDASWFLWGRMNRRHQQSTADDQKNLALSKDADGRQPYRAAPPEHVEGGWRHP